MSKIFKIFVSKNYIVEDDILFNKEKFPNINYVTNDKIKLKTKNKWKIQLVDAAGRVEQTPSEEIGEVTEEPGAPEWEQRQQVQEQQSQEQQSQEQQAQGSSKRHSTLVRFFSRGIALFCALALYLTIDI